MPFESIGSRSEVGAVNVLPGSAAGVTGTGSLFLTRTAPGWAAAQKIRRVCFALDPVARRAHRPLGLRCTGGDPYVQLRADEIGRSLTLRWRLFVPQANLAGARTDASLLAESNRVTSPISATITNPVSDTTPRSVARTLTGGPTVRAHEPRWKVMSLAIDVHHDQLGARTGLTTTQTRARRRLTPSTAVSALCLVGT